MNIKKTLSVLIGSLVLSTGAASSLAGDYYFGTQFAQMTYEQSTTPGNPNAVDGEGEPNAIVLIGGYNINDRVAIEGRLGFDAGDDDFSSSLGLVAIEVSQIVSLLGKFSVGDNISPYALIGISDVELESALGETSELNGVSFGVGVDFKVSENTAIALEYIQYADEDIPGGGNAEFSAVSFGLSFGF